jgi:hypothetical protein
MLCSPSYVVVPWQHDEFLGPQQVLQLDEAVSRVRLVVRLVEAERVTGKSYAADAGEAPSSLKGFMDRLAERWRLAIHAGVAEVMEVSEVGVREMNYAVHWLGGRHAAAACASGLLSVANARRWRRARDTPPDGASRPWSQLRSCRR